MVEEISDAIIPDVVFHTVEYGDGRPDKVYEMKVTEIGILTYPSYYDYLHFREVLRSVTFGLNITRVDARVFEYSHLETVNFNDNLREIGAGAF